MRNTTCVKYSQSWLIWSFHLLLGTYYSIIFDYHAISKFTI